MGDFNVKVGGIEDKECGIGPFGLIEMIEATMTCWRLSAKQLAYPSPRIAYNVFNMDRKLHLIAKLPLIIGV